MKPAGRSRLLLIVGVGVVLIAVVATAAFLATGGFTSRQPDPEALKQEERDQRILDIRTVYTPATVRKLLGPLKPKNKPGEMPPGLKGRTLIVAAEIVDETVPADVSKLPDDLLERTLGSEQEPWKGLFPEGLVKTAKVDLLTFDLPEEIWPGAEKTVGTVVWVRWLKQLVGRYAGDGALATGVAASDAGPKTRSAYKWFAVVAVLDRDTSAVRDARVFTGGDPPAKITGDATSGAGTKPMSLVRKYLLELKRG